MISWIYYVVDNKDIYKKHSLSIFISAYRAPLGQHRPAPQNKFCEAPDVRYEGQLERRED